MTPVSNTHTQRSHSHTPTPLDDFVVTIENVFSGFKQMCDRTSIIEYCTESYLEKFATLYPDEQPKPRDVRQDLLVVINHAISANNTSAASSAIERNTPQRELTAWQLAQLMLHFHSIIRIAPHGANTDQEYDLLAMYQSTGESAGVYTTSEEDIRRVTRSYDSSMSLNDFKDVVATLREDALRTTQNTHRDLIAVNNGVFYYGAETLTHTVNGTTFTFEPKKLHPFDPALVFMTKSHINYVENPQNPTLSHADGTRWDVVSWMEDIAGSPGLATLLWEIVGAIIRPHVRWGKSAWFYSSVGNNGKGSLCELMRNLCGPRAHTSIPLSDFGKEFALEPLVYANAIIVDENDVGTFIDKAANLKAIVTNDVIQINRKYRPPVAYQFWGIMVQCLNNFPLFKDKSESFYRRQLFVPFEKTFTGRERKYIKDDYLSRQSVLEFVLWYVLHQAGAETPGHYYSFSEPAETKRVLAEYKLHNDPVRDFWEEFRLIYVWDLLPFPFLYDHFKAWFAKNSPSGIPINSRRFNENLREVMTNDTIWDCDDHTKQYRPGTKMALTEPLVDEFDLDDWKNLYSRGQKTRLYRGVVRRPTPTSHTQPDDSASPQGGSTHD